VPPAPAPRSGRGRHAATGQQRRRGRARRAAAPARGSWASAQAREGLALGGVGAMGQQRRHDEKSARGGEATWETLSG